MNPHPWNTPKADPLATETRQCKNCMFSKQLIDGWICKKHLMAITPDMRVTYKVSEGSCWQAKPALPKYAYRPRLVKGEVTFKEFVLNLSERLGISYHCLEQRIHRGKYQLDESRVRRGPTGRAIAVRI